MAAAWAAAEADLPVASAAAEASAEAADTQVAHQGCVVVRWKELRAHGRAFLHLSLPAARALASALAEAELSARSILTGWPAQAGRRVRVIQTAAAACSCRLRQAVWRGARRAAGCSLGAAPAFPHPVAGLSWVWRLQAHPGRRLWR